MSDKPLLGYSRSVETNRIGEAINQNHRCQACGSDDVLFGEVRKYGIEVYLLRYKIFQRKGKNVYCRECRDPIRYEMQNESVSNP